MKRNRLRRSAYFFPLDTLVKIGVMLPRIIENHSETTVDVGGIVRRILKHLPSDILDGLNEIVVLDKNEEVSAFGCYWRLEKRIELYMDGLTLWQPWILKKTYVFPYICIGLTLAHEIDHHVSSKDDTISREVSAEHNAFKYLYPSMGALKPLVKLTYYLMLFYSRMRKRSVFDVTTE